MARGRRRKSRGGRKMRRSGNTRRSKTLRGGVGAPRRKYYQGGGKF